MEKKEICTKNQAKAQNQKFMHIFYTTYAHIKLLRKPTKWCFNNTGAKENGVLKENFTGTL